MSLNIKKLSDDLVSNKALYNECGQIYTYLNELKINFANTEIHSMAWQYSQVIEIVYSNKLENIDLNILDVIIGYSNEDEVNDKIKDLIKVNLNATINLSNYRKENQKLKFFYIDNIANIISKNELYKKINIDKNVIDNFETDIFEKLINSTYSNNGLYFVGLFLNMITNIYENTSGFNIIRSILLNLYLMQTKLLFAPTLCFSYILSINRKSYNLALHKCNNDENIFELSKIAFDFIKQAAIVSRGLLNKSILTFSHLEEIMITNEKIKKLNIKNYKKMFDCVSFTHKKLMKLLKINDENVIDDFVNELLVENIITKISRPHQNETYMFSEMYKSIKKIDDNKSQPTSKIFILKEGLS